MSTSRPIYLDYNATTPVDPRCVSEMLPFFSETFGNSISADHAFGWDAKAAVEKARARVAKLIDCETREVVFTSGATEGNNWVIQTLVNDWKAAGSKGVFQIVSSDLEHMSVRQNLRWAERQGAKVDLVKCSATGELDLQQFERLLSADTKLVSIMAVNNEIGVINPIEEIGKICKQKQVYFHCDATQAVGKIPFDFRSSNVDLMTFSGHKFYAPKGSGALIIRRRDPAVRLPSFILGGGHENGMRAGTLNVPAIVGLGSACEILTTEGSAEIAKLRELQVRFFQNLTSLIPGLELNGPPIGAKRSPNNLNLRFTKFNLPVTLPGIAASRGSACASGGTEISSVLQNIGLSEKQAVNCLRLSFGRFSTAEELARAADVLAGLIK